MLLPRHPPLLSFTLLTLPDSTALEFHWKRTVICISVNRQFDRQIEPVLGTKPLRLGGESLE